MFFNIHFSIERWKFNKKYNIYVSTQGRFKDKAKNFIEPIPLNGYMRLRLGDEVVSAHRVVLMTFHPVADETLTVDHIDHNKRNNALENLRWLPHNENCQDEAVLTFIDNLKDLGVLEYVNGLRPAPTDETMSKSQRKHLNKQLKKDKKEKIKKEIPTKTAMKIEGLKKTTIFDVSRETDAAQGLNYEQAVQYIHSKTGVKANKIKHYFCAYLNEGRTEQNRFGYTIKLHYKEAA